MLRFEPVQGIVKGPRAYHAGDDDFRYLIVESEGGWHAARLPRDRQHYHGLHLLGPFPRRRECERAITGKEG